MGNYARDYVNIDSLEKTKKNGFSLKKTLWITGLSLGIGGAILATSTLDESSNSKANTGLEQSASSKVFKSYEIKSGDTLTSIIKQIMTEYPETAKYYTEEGLLKEVVKTNNLSGNGNYITAGNYIVIPYYIATVIMDEQMEFYDEQEEKAEKLNDFEQYVLQSGDSYWSIASKYTDDDNELIILIGKIQKLNDNRSLIVGDTITIPNIEKYKLTHAEYEETIRAR